MKNLFFLPPGVIIFILIMVVSLKLESFPIYLDEDWEAISPNWTDGVVTTVVADTSGNVFCGGSFTTINGISVKRTAKWNGTQWQSMGNGFDDGAVEKMVLGSGGIVYASGSFTRSGVTYFNRIAKWTGSSWAKLGNGFNDVVYAVTITVDGKLFAGGKFTQSGASPIKYFNRIAFWDGSTWDEPKLGVSGGTNPTVSALASDTYGNVYVGGEFQSAGTLPVSNIVRWGGNDWHALGSGVNGPVYALAVDSTGKVYAGGNFTVAGGVSVNKIAVWDGVAWHPLGAGVNGVVYSIITQSEDSVFVGGNFTVAGGTISSNSLAWWCAGAWRSITSGVSGGAREIKGLTLNLSGDLYVGGNFYTTGNVYSYKVGKLKKPPVFIIRYFAGSGGSINGNATQSIMRGDNSTEVVAVPDPGYTFDRWSDGLLTANRTETNVTANHNFTAYFISTAEGVNEGEGTSEGVQEGIPSEGLLEGLAEGSPEGEGIHEGITEGGIEGTHEGMSEGVIEGITEGEVEGIIEGVLEGISEGSIEGIPEGINEGEGIIEEGSVEGNVEGMFEGVVEGEGSAEGEFILTAWIEGGNYVNRVVGESYTFSVHVAGAQGTINYQWYCCKDIHCSTPEEIRNITTQNFMIENLVIEDTGWYWCQVSDDFNAVETQRVYLNVHHGLNINACLFYIILLLGFTGGLCIMVNVKTNKVKF